MKKYQFYYDKSHGNTKTVIKYMSSHYGYCNTRVLVVDVVTKERRRFEGTSACMGKRRWTIDLLLDGHKGEQWRKVLLLGAT